MTVVTKPQGCSSTAAAGMTGIRSRTSRIRDMRPVLRSVMPLLLKPVCRRNISHSAANLLIAPCSMEHTDAYDLKPLNASVNAYSICPLKGPCCLQLPGPLAAYSCRGLRQITLREYQIRNQQAQSAAVKKHSCPASDDALHTNYNVPLNAASLSTCPYAT